jgi:hypothetical protein
MQKTFIQKAMIIFSISATPNREKNLSVILPNILKQSDLLFVNLINYKYVPEILNHKKIMINRFDNAGSEIRFFDYTNIPNDSYYFTIDDDILYPENYSEIMISNMQDHNNNVVCCVHGSNIDKNLTSDFYKKNRQVFHFKDSLLNNTEVMIPGVGTSCFYKEKTKINIDNYKVSNMSDTYTACFLAEQSIKRISVKREKNWLKPLDEFGSRIFGNNPYHEIDNMINKYKDIL